MKDTSFVENALRDILFGARMLRRNPGFTIIAALTLALGIGATSSVFSLVQGVLLTPPPYPQPGQVMLIQPVRLDGEPRLGGSTTEQWSGWQKESKSFAAMAGYDWTFDYMRLPEGSAGVAGLEVTSDYFNVIGIKPIVGRAFLESEMPTNPERATSLILGYDLWQRRFHGDTNVVGKVVHLSRHEPLTVVGVMPPGVRFLPSFGEEANPGYDVNARADYWLPAAPDPAKPTGGSGNGPWSVAGRLRSRVTPAQAQVELTAITVRQAHANDYYQGLTVRVQPLTEFLNRDGRRLLLPLSGAVALVFLIACGNATGLLVARGLQRHQEYAVRCALGASRLRLVRQVLAESLLLALLGGVMGIVLMVAIVHGFKAVGGSAIPRLDAVSVGGPVLACCLVASVIAAVLAGLMPALRTLHTEPAQAIKGSGPTGSTTRSERRLLGGVAAVQLALTLALLVGAGLLIRTVANLTRVRAGFNTAHILTMSVMFNGLDMQHHDDYDHVLLERISALPGVNKAAFVWGLPLTGNRWINEELRVEGHADRTKAADKVPVGLLTVTPEYFDTVGMNIIEGRDFRRADNFFDWKNWDEPVAGETPCVCIINQAMAEKFFPNANPIGRKLITWPWLKRPKQIVGIVGDARTLALTRKVEPEVYFPFYQMYPFTSHFIVRTTSNPLSLAATVQRELRRLDPTAAVDHVKTFDQIRAESVAPQTLAMQLLVGFSLVGSVLALVGVYGVLSLSVSSRKRELAIRLAVGAPRRTIVGLVLASGLKLIVVGLLIGTGIAMASTRLLQGFLFGVESTDWVTFVLVGLSFTAVALLACLPPTLRATRVDPMSTLRCE